MHSKNQRPLPFLSVHDLIEVTLDFRSRTQLRELHIRDWSNFDSEAYLDCLQECNWSDLALALTIHEKVGIFNRMLAAAYDIHIPMRSFRAKRPPAPWLNEHVRALMRGKDAARGRYRRCPTDQNFCDFHILRNDTRMEIERAKNFSPTAPCRIIEFGSPMSRTPFAWSCKI